MSTKIDWRELTRNFLLGEFEDPDATESSVELLKEAGDRKLLIKHEASRLCNMFNNYEIEALISEIKRH